MPLLRLPLCCPPLVVVGLLGATSVTVLAQQPAPAVSSGLTQAVPAAEVVTLTYANRPITTLRARVLTNAPVDRAAAAVLVLDLLVDSSVTGPVTARVEQGVAFIRVGTRDVFTLVPADLNDLTGETIDEKVAETVPRLQLALTEAAEARAPFRLLRAVLLALLATGVFVVSLGGLVRLNRRLSTAILAESRRRLGSVLPGEFLHDRPSRLGAVMRRTTSLLLLSVAAVLTYGWLTFTLRQFPYSRPVGESLRSHLLGAISGFGVKVAGAMPGLFTVLLIVLATRLAVYIVTVFFENVERGAVNLSWTHPETARVTRRWIVLLLWLFALIVAYPHLPGSNTDAFKGVSVFLGLVFSLGSSGIVNQVMSGMTMTYARAMQQGDIVRVGDVQGIVTGTTLLSVKIRTFVGEEVTLPNAVVIGQPTTNFTKLAPGGGAYLTTSVTIGYDTPWRQVRSLLLLAAERTPNIQRDPPPRAITEALEDFYVRYRLAVCVGDRAERTITLDRLHSQILDVFNEFGVQIMSPNYEADPEGLKIVPKEQWHAAPAKADAPAGV
jgi:small-conductance mechanosensitive channel